MLYDVEILGFEKQEIKFQAPGLIKGGRLLVNGEEAAKGTKRGTFMLRKDDDTEVLVSYKNTFLDIPGLIVDGQVYNIVEPLKWYQWLWAGIPVVVIFMGGVLGAIIGFLAVHFSTRVYRSGMEEFAKYLVVGLISGTAFVVYFVTAMILGSLIRGL